MLERSSQNRGITAEPAANRRAVAENEDRAAGRARKAAGCLQGTSPQIRNEGSFVDLVRKIVEHGRKAFFRVSITDPDRQRSQTPTDSRTNQNAMLKAEVNPGLLLVDTVLKRSSGQSDSEDPPYFNAQMTFKVILQSEYADFSGIRISSRFRPRMRLRLQGGAAGGPIDVRERTCRRGGVASVRHLLCTGGNAARRQKGINFTRIESVQPHDETTLFCSAGMQQYKSSSRIPLTLEPSPTARHAYVWATSIR